MVDYLIVGQGIAGSMLSWFLLQAGASVRVIDSLNSSSASNIASGITNPITGRRMVKTWMADEIIPFAGEVYRHFEKLFGQQFYYPFPIIRLLNSVKEQNDWSVRCATSGYTSYLDNQQLVYLNDRQVQNNFGGFEISGASIVNTREFLNSYRNFLTERDILIEEAFEYGKLKNADGMVRYKNLEARKIIFCEGADALQNPWFKYLPFVPAKGECLIIQIPGFYTDRIISQEVIIMPLPWKPGYFYIGATHDWNYSDSMPSEQGGIELLANLEAILKAPFEIISQHAAIRPTVKDRRPLIGFHPEQQAIGIFNGMGTKGISLAPFFGKHFVEHLLGRTALNPEVDIARFV